MYVQLVIVMFSYYSLKANNGWIVGARACLQVTIAAFPLTTFALLFAY